MSANFTDYTGIYGGGWQFSLTGMYLKDDGSGNLQVWNSNAATAYGSVSCSNVLVNGNSITLNAGATESGASWKLLVARPSSGMTADWTMTLPTTPGATNQAMVTDGAGNMSWATIPTTANLSIHSVSLAFGTTSPLTLITLPANASVIKIRIHVDTAFTGGTGANVSVGITGTTSKYMSATQSSLGTVGIYEVNPNNIPDISTEALIATYSAGSASAGAARIEIQYAVPSGS